MQFQNVDEVSHDAKDVFLLIRDDMPSLVPYLNDVQGIDVLKREERDGGVVYIVNEWRGSESQVPKMVRKFLKPELLGWTDYATWYDAGPPRAEWKLEPKVGASLFECSGTTSITETTPGNCKIKIQGDLKVYPERLPGVPRLLAGRVRGRIESFVVSLLAPNMATMARGVQAFFDDKKSGLGDIPPDA